MKTYRQSTLDWTDTEGDPMVIQSDGEIFPDDDFMRKVPAIERAEKRYHHFRGMLDTDPDHTRILMCLALHGEQTAREVLQGTEILYYIVQRKIGQLMKDMKIEKSGKRFCRVERKRRWTYGIKER